MNYEVISIPYFCTLIYLASQLHPYNNEINLANFKSVKVHTWHVLIMLLLRDTVALSHIPVCCALGAFKKLILLESLQIYLFPYSLMYFLKM